MIQLIFTLTALLFIPFFWMSLSWTLTHVRVRVPHTPAMEWANQNALLKNDCAMQKSIVDEIASMSELTHKDWQANIGMVSYMKGRTRINVYTTVMTVAIAEPGKKQRYVYNVSDELLKEIFANPNLF